VAAAAKERNDLGAKWSDWKFYTAADPMIRAQDLKDVRGDLIDEIYDRIFNKLMTGKR
jgi:hypothetical protein